MGRPGRREFVKWGLAGAAGAVLVERVHDYVSESRVRAKIVIVGGGTAGISMAAHLAERLRHDDITVIEPSPEHHYQPGYTMIAGGVFEPQSVVRPTRDLIPRQVKWMQDAVTALDPGSNSLDTAKSGKVSYDFLVLVPGCKVDFGLIQGVRREDLGRHNIHCIYDYRGAIACRDAIQRLPQQTAARLVFATTHTKLKCGGAPKKICLMTEDLLRDRNVRERFRIEYYTPQKELMKPKVFGDRLVQIFAQREIPVAYHHRLVAIDPAAKKAVFEVASAPAEASSAAPRTVSVEFDFLHFVPPMSAPDFVKNSPLADTANPGGWVAVDQRTLVHPKFRNVLALGDAAGLPTSKTGAAIRKQAPVAAANLVSLMEGKEPRSAYDGYSACPIITEYGKVLMCEFGYNEKLLPSLPWLDPARERALWWRLKAHGLKPMYFHGMLKGLI